MIDLIGLVFGVPKELVQLSDIFPGFAKVERAEVLVEGFILQILYEN